MPENTFRSIFMIVQTGEIKPASELQKEIRQGFAIPIKESDMTPKQRGDRIVSKWDSRSKLGKQRAKAHKKLLRSVSCPCGSGIKYKNCCRNVKVS